MLFNLFNSRSNLLTHVYIDSWLGLVLKTMFRIVYVITS